MDAFTILFPTFSREHHRHMGLCDKCRVRLYRVWVVLPSKVPCAINNVHVYDPAQNIDVHVQVKNRVAKII
jgi:hypothetical protein